MKYGKKIYLSIFWVLLGGVLAVCGLTGTIDDVWGTTGFALMAVGGLQIFRQLRYRRDEGYKEKVDVAIEDERNRVIRGKAWAWAGYLFVIVSALASIVLRVVGRGEMADLAACGVALLVLLYWGSYLVLQKKY